MRRHAFALYCLLLTLLAIAAAEFVLLPQLHGLPRATLLAGFAARPADIIDGQRINALGFTGDDIAAQKAPGTVRVLLLGSSTLFNRHLGERLKAALQQRSGKTVELLDAGIRSHTSRADLLKLQLLAHYQWDYVLFYDGINDLWANHVLPQDFHDDYRQLDPWYYRNALLDRSLLARYGYNLLHAQWRTLNRRLGERWQPDYQFVFAKKPYVNAAGFASLESYRNNVSAIINLAQHHGATPVLLTFASYLPDNYTRQAFLDGTLGYHNPDQYDSRDVFNWGPPAYVREGLQRQNAILRELAAQHGVPLVDIDSAMSGRGEWFGDVCHFNDEGVDVFVNHVANALSPLR